MRHVSEVAGAPHRRAVPFHDARKRQEAFKKTVRPHFLMGKVAAAADEGASGEPLSLEHAAASLFAQLQSNGKFRLMVSLPAIMRFIAEGRDLHRKDAALADVEIVFHGTKVSRLWGNFYHRNQKNCKIPRPI